MTATFGIRFIVTSLLLFLFVFSLRISFDICLPHKGTHIASIPSASSSALCGVARSWDVQARIITVAADTAQSRRGDLSVAGKRPFDIIRVAKFYNFFGAFPTIITVVPEDKTIFQELIVWFLFVALLITLSWEVIDRLFFAPRQWAAVEEQLEGNENMRNILPRTSFLRRLVSSEGQKPGPPVFSVRDKNRNKY